VTSLYSAHNEIQTIQLRIDPSCQTLNSKDKNQNFKFVIEVVVERQILEGEIKSAVKDTQNNPNHVLNKPLLAHELNKRSVGYSEQDTELSYRILKTLQECNVIPKEFSDPTNIEGLKMSIEKEKIALDDATIQEIFQYLNCERTLANNSTKLAKSYYTNKANGQKISMLDFFKDLIGMVHSSHKEAFNKELFIKSNFTSGARIFFVGVVLLIVSQLICWKRPV
jgi:hypothetical protein